MCSDCFVTAAMKSRVAAHADAFRTATQSPFGSDDEIDMLNLVDATPRGGDAQSRRLAKPLGEAFRTAH
jgi:hypothetical protein